MFFRRLAALALTGVVLSSCSYLSGEKDLNDSETMLLLCERFVDLKIKASQLIASDAFRREEEQIFRKADLIIIYQANETLNGYCPIPDGYTPLSKTVEAASDAVQVLANYTRGR